MKEVWEADPDEAPSEENRLDCSACPTGSLKNIYPRIQTVIRPGQVQKKARRWRPELATGLPTRFSDQVGT